MLPLIRALKRTYSHRHQAAVSSSPGHTSGLATPPPSSSPPTSSYMPDRLVRGVIQSPVRCTTRVEKKRVRMGPKNINTLPTRSKKTTHPKKGQESTTKNNKPKLMQMHFNLLPSHITCKECGMSYTRTSPCDVTLHTSFHETHLFGLSVPYQEGFIKLGFVKRDEINLVKKCSEVVDSELSASTPRFDSTFQLYGLVSRNNNATGPARLVSFLLCHPICTAFPLLQSGELNTTRPVSSVIMGVSRIWTAQKMRGRGIARNLLDKMCQTGVVGCQIDKSEVAFTQLSGSGEQVVRKWISTKDANVLVYNE